MVLQRVGLTFQGEEYGQEQLVGQHPAFLDQAPHRGHAIE
jgi:hypothetical protein